MPTSSQAKMLQKNKTVDPLGRMKSTTTPSSSSGVKQYYTPSKIPTSAGWGAASAGRGPTSSGGRTYHNSNNQHKKLQKLKQYNSVRGDVFSLTTPDHPVPLKKYKITTPLSAARTQDQEGVKTGEVDEFKSDPDALKSILDNTGLTFQIQNKGNVLDTEVVPATPQYARMVEAGTVMSARTTELFYNFQDLCRRMSSRMTLDHPRVVVTGPGGQLRPAPATVHKNMLRSTGLHGLPRASVCTADGRSTPSSSAVLFKSPLSIFARRPLHKTPLTTMSARRPLHKTPLTTISARRVETPSSGQLFRRPDNGPDQKHVQFKDDLAIRLFQDDNDENIAPLTQDQRPPQKRPHPVNLPPDVTRMHPATLHDVSEPVVNCGVVVTQPDVVLAPVSQFEWGTVAPCPEACTRADPPRPVAGVNRLRPFNLSSVKDRSERILEMQSVQQRIQKELELLTARLDTELTASCYDEDDPPSLPIPLTQPM